MTRVKGWKHRENDRCVLKPQLMCLTSLQEGGSWVDVRFTYSTLRKKKKKKKKGCTCLGWSTNRNNKLAKIKLIIFGYNLAGVG